jgi:hypothetical protein
VFPFRLGVTGYKSYVLALLCQILKTASFLKHVGMNFCIENFATLIHSLEAELL